VGDQKGETYSRPTGKTSVGCEPVVVIQNPGGNWFPLAKSVPGTATLTVDWAVQSFNLEGGGEVTGNVEPHSDRGLAESTNDCGSMLGKYTPLVGKTDVRV
jgi:hypothetical protein